ncbi:type IV secretion system protein [Helicobacter suis]|uniref:type IV secretion system protein n=1 Tax=Helicobacter suis TaxID=104628 RepID=UPI00248F8F2A|nr:type IV secretion system protein [Helicobacter suis]
MQESQYTKFIGLFENFINQIALLLPSGLSSALQASGNVIGVLLILLFVFSKLKKDDLFEIRTLIAIGIFFGYLAFFNWSMNHPKDSQSYFRSFIEYPADQVMGALSTLKFEGYQETNKTETISFKSRTIDTLISEIFHSTGNLVTRTFQSLKTGTILYMIPIVLTILVIAVLEALFVFHIVYFICVTFIEITLYFALYILFIPLVFFQQTRGFAWSYIKKVVSLTFYAPFITLVSLLDYNILTFIKNGTTNMEALPQQGFLESIFSTIHVKFSDYVDFLLDLTFIALGAYFCLKLVSKIPEMINAIFGTQGVMSDASHFVSSAISLVQAPIAATAGLAKGGYTQGGIGGALANIATMGGYKGVSDLRNHAILSKETSSNSTANLGGKVGTTTVET